MNDTLYIKNMVCERCIRVVREELEKLGLRLRRVDLGEVEVEDMNDVSREDVQTILAENGFELIEDRRAETIEHIKIAIRERVHSVEPVPENFRLSQFIAQKLDRDYSTMSRLFSSVENMTIEHFFILQKIERAKEWLKYGDMTLSEIAWQLGYSSVQHLSAQFKTVTGMTASRFKELRQNLRKPIDKL